MKTKYLCSSLIAFFMLLLCASHNTIEAQRDSLLSITLPTAGHVFESDSIPQTEPAAPHELSAIFSSDSSAYAYYAAGQYERAVKSYEQLLQNNPHTAALYYNLGTAYYQTKQYGLSILMLERAKRLNPYDKDIANNLSLARSKIIDATEPTPLFTAYLLDRVTGFLGLRMLIAMGLFTAVVFVVASLFFLLGRNRKERRIGFYVANLMLFFSLLFNLLSWYNYRNYRDNRDAVVLYPQVELKTAPDRSSTTIALLHEGAKLHLRKAGKEGWYAVKSSDGKNGWLLSEEVGLVVPQE
ncbi:Flp pilus assembly protein TadD, contains TPR repeats [Porphyromonas crevioricanis]|uniref:Flp pilus assembly protein TadD, contains TPR repeats n=1 Tax=Porphyromonas crevioricanis TaxID=393921 RepID=A0A2X4SRK3_9PORP|nr:tetratricopeptide repeat protein [Porphyromonas crevioricanis]GAD08550.1 BatE, TRP domain containing protein [Porphyromonas crevioricanis JCM 13913]SQH72511.1 Flp pilus assembly protein TadD, contains TPR repeats [Porphyromonas crevioricanis]